LRVIQEGMAEAGTPMTLLHRPLPEWTIDRVFRLLIGGGHKKDPAGVRALANMPVLAETWRDRARKLAPVA
jgi:MOSC domain-containing protein YiiM